MIWNETTIAEFHRLLNYDPETGIFTWKVKRGLKRNAGDVAGHRHSTGHIYIEINQRAYSAARVAWAMVTNAQPRQWIDHRNGNPADNRFANLREASPLENARNVKLSRRNTSGFKGASWYGPLGKWAGKIRVNGRLLHLGYFATVEAAHEAYVAAANKYFGDFARVA